MEQSIKVLKECACVYTGKSGTYVGPYYVGPLVTNLFNTGTQQPLNRWTNDQAACTRMYNETVRLVHETNHTQAPASL